MRNSLSKVETDGKQKCRLNGKTVHFLKQTLYQVENGETDYGIKEKAGDRHERHPSGRDAGA